MPGAARQAIAEPRGASGFGRIGEEAWARAIDALADTHASAGMAAVAAMAAGPERLSELCEAAQEGGGAAGGFLDRLVRRYARRIEPQRTAAEEELGTCATRIRNGEETGSHLPQVDNLLKRWLRLSRVVIARAAAAGLDERQAKTLFETLRSLPIDLCNDQGRYEEAQALAQLLRIAFASLPRRRPGSISIWRRWRSWFGAHAKTQSCSRSRTRWRRRRPISRPPPPASLRVRFGREQRHRRTAARGVRRGAGADGGIFAPGPAVAPRASGRTGAQQRFRYAYSAAKVNWWHAAA